MQENPVIRGDAWCLLLGNGINFHHPAQLSSPAAGEHGKKEKRAIK